MFLCSTNQMNSMSSCEWTVLSSSLDLRPQCDRATLTHQVVSRRSKTPEGCSWRRIFCSLQDKSCWGTSGCAEQTLHLTERMDDKVKKRMFRSETTVLLEGKRKWFVAVQEKSAVCPNKILICCCLSHLFVNC